MILSERNQSKKAALLKIILYNSNNITFWKRQTVDIIKISVVVGEVGVCEQVEH